MGSPTRVKKGGREGGREEEKEGGREERGMMMRSLYMSSIRFCAREGGRKGGREGEKGKDKALTNVIYLFLC